MWDSSFQRVMEHYLSDIRVLECGDKNKLPDLVSVNTSAFGSFEHLLRWQTFQFDGVPNGNPLEGLKF